MPKVSKKYRSGRCGVGSSEMPGLASVGLDYDAFGAPCGLIIVTNAVSLLKSSMTEGSIPSVP